MLISNENPANDVELELSPDLELSDLGGKNPAPDQQEDPEQVPGVLISEN
jgi:hypothetical protein